MRAADATLEPLIGRADGPNEDLSLIGTQALRRMLGHDDDPPEEPGPDTVDGGGGFDPCTNT